VFIKFLRNKKKNLDENSKLENKKKNLNDDIKLENKRKMSRQKIYMMTPN